ncbi:hypothetical protein BGZ83_002156 [Gryganskiella cystojenkinii]|nr:hypothetical protein BGZ83_002156 [Gryganskiella cystojenkinii]
MPSPLGIPEILCLITRYLTQQQLTTCVCVSQDWNLLFGGFVWRDLKVVPLKDPGTISLPWKTVERNLNDIEVLDFRSLEDCYPDRPYSDRVRVERADFERWDCPYLKSLSFRMDVYRTLGQPDPILRYPMLTHLDFGSVEYITGLHNGTIWSAAASCPLLQSLSVTKVDLVSRDWSHFYALWSRLRRLHLRKLGIHTRNIFVGNGLVISGAPETFFQGLGPSKLQELGLFDLHGLNGINGQLWFLNSSMCH